MRVKTHAPRAYTKLHYITLHYITWIDSSFDIIHRHVTVHIYFTDVRVYVHNKMRTLHAHMTYTHHVEYQNSHMNSHFRVHTYIVCHICIQNILEPKCLCSTLPQRTRNLTEMKSSA